MNLLVIDTETTGLDPKECEVTEVAAAIYNVEIATVIWQSSSFLKTEIPGGFEPHSQISQAMCDAIPDALAHGTKHEIEIAGTYCDAAVAHNANFDQSFIEKTGLKLRNGEGKLLPWVCTREDIVFPESVKGRRLGHIAVDLGIPMVSWHRAADDVITLCNILKHVPDLKLQVKIAMKPRAMFRALVSYDNKDLAKQRGFRWDPARKFWIKRMPLDTPAEPIEGRPFKVIRIEGPVYTS